MFALSVQSHTARFDISTEKFCILSNGSQPPRPSRRLWTQIDDLLPVPSFALGQCRPAKLHRCFALSVWVSCLYAFQCRFHATRAFISGQGTLAAGNRGNKQRLSWPRLACYRRPVVHLSSCEECSWLVHFLLPSVTNENRLQNYISIWVSSSF
jgi:hypothetical protein